MAWLFLVVFFLFARQPAIAQVPLFYQLIQAYQPVSVAGQVPLEPTAFVAAAIPVPSTGQVLGVASNAPAAPYVVPGNNSPPTDPAKVVTVAVLGDSMIDTLGDGIPKLQKALEYYYPGRKFRILNYGVGGSTIDYALFRLSSSYQYLGKNIPPLLSTEPDIVVIESFAYNNFGNTQAGIDKQWLNLGAITTVIKNKLPRTKIVMAAAIAPNSITYANGVKDLHLTALDKIERVSTIDLYLQNLVNFATSQSYPLADAYHPSLTDGKNGRKDLINTTDYIHPSELGNQFFCDIVAKSVFDNKLL